MKKKLASYIVNLLAVAIVFFVIFTLIGNGTLNRYYTGIVIMICINIIMATSLNLTTGFLGHLALGHAGFMAVGAYSAALFTKNVAMDIGVSFPISLLFGGIVAAVFGIIIGVPALRLKGDYLAIITLGFGEIIRVLIINFDFTGGAKGLSKIARMTNFAYVFIIMAVIVALLFTIGRSRHGRAILSIREDEIAAEASGIPTTYYKVYAFTLAAFFAGIAGGLYAHYAGVLDPKNFGFNKSIEYLVMVVLGGMGSISGSIIAATVLTLLPEVLRGFSDYRMLIYSVLLIIMMLFRPKGLLGTSEFSLFGIFLRLTGKKAENPPTHIVIQEEAIPQKLLETKNLGITFGGLHAVEDVNLSIDRGEIVGLIGPNGAGKTTVFNLLTNVYIPTEGTITVDGKSIVGLPTHAITKVGIARTFQNIRLFKNLTVLQNIKIAYHNQMSYSALDGAIRDKRYWEDEKIADEHALELLSVFDMEKFAYEKAMNLPYGQQRKLEICRALAADPKLLLLDEPAAGMNPNETLELMTTIRRIREQFNITILLIEHDMKLVMGICERIYVLNYGRIIAEGAPDEIRNNPEVITAYLGKDDEGEEA